MNILSRNIRESLDKILGPKENNSATVQLNTTGIGIGEADRKIFGFSGGSRGSEDQIREKICLKIEESKDH